VGRGPPPRDGARGGDGIPARIATRGARLALALAALAIAAAVALSALLSEPSGGGVVLGAGGLALLAVRHPIALVGALVALGIATAVALDRGATAAAAPLWGTGLLVAGALAERSLTLPGDGEIEAEALLGWLAGLGVLAGVGLTAGALVLLAATTSAGTTVVGLVAGAVLAVVPAALARRRATPGGGDAR
jgi:hypothetical protein